VTEQKNHSPPPAVISAEVLGAGKWLRLEELTYRDRHGALRRWEAAFRQGRQFSVLIIPRLVPGDKFVLIEQFRPALNGYALEFPAGLVDAGEDAAAAACRELREETGYVGRVVWVSNPGLNTPGMTSEATSIALVDIDTGLPENRNPMHCREETEDITVHVVAAADMAAFVAAREQAGTRTDTRIIAYFLARNQL
jgi:ADP-ribose pyrophosphatase